MRVRGRPFRKGDQRINRKGRPQLPSDVINAREYSKKYTRDAIDELAKIAFNPKASLSARVTALNSLIDRAAGKPTTPLEIESSAPLTAVEILVPGWRKNG
jgi:hypothetical protein